MESAIQTLVKVFLKSSKGKDFLGKKEFQSLVSTQLSNILSDTDSKEAVNNMGKGLDSDQDGKVGFEEYMKLVGYLAVSLSEQRNLAKEEPEQNSASAQVAQSTPDKEEAKGEAKEEAKPEANEEPKAEATADAKVEANAEAKAEVKVEASAEGETQPEAAKEEPAKEEPAKEEPAAAAVVAAAVEAAATEVEVAVKEEEKVEETVKTEEEAEKPAAAADAAAASAEEEGEKKTEEATS